LSLSKYFQLTDNQYRFRQAQPDKSSCEDFLDLFSIQILHLKTFYRVSVILTQRKNLSTEDVLVLTRQTRLKTKPVS